MNIKYKRKRLVWEEKLRLATDFNGGLNYKQCAIKYGVKPSTVFNILKEVINKK